MTELRTAIVGSGFVARVHAAAVRDLGGMVVAVCSRTTSGAEALAAEIEGNVSAYDSLAQLLNLWRIVEVHLRRIAQRNGGGLAGDCATV